jgi:hypothetical protein
VKRKVLFEDFLNSWWRIELNGIFSCCFDLNERKETFNQNDFCFYFNIHQYGKSLILKEIFENKDIRRYQYFLDNKWIIESDILFIDLIFTKYYCFKHIKAFLQANTDDATKFSIWIQNEDMTKIKNETNHFSSFSLLKMKFKSKIISSFW